MVSVVFINKTTSQTLPRRQFADSRNKHTTLHKELLHAISLDNELGQIIPIIFKQLVVNPAITPKTFELNIKQPAQVRYQFAIIRYYLVAVFGRWVF
jgi:outer membrane lipoprotein-sorting protein